MDTFISITDALWEPLAYVALGFGLLITIATKGLVFRRFPDMVRGMFEGKLTNNGTSSFQALMITLADRVGVGNIAGVAIAIFAGGPGALFWMFISTVVGTGTALSETILGQVYKRKIEGEYRGGVPFYIEHGLKMRWLGIIVAFIFIAAYAVFVPGIQANSVTVSIEAAFSIPTWLTGAFLVGALALIAIGGTKRIVKVCQFIIPILGILYLGFALYILIINFSEIGAVASLVFGAAFGYDAIFGAMLGTAVAWGIRRATHSTGTGFGELAFASSSAAVSHPVKQGMVQAFSSVASICVAMATGAMLLMTNSYNVTDGAGGYLVNNLDGVSAGPQYTQEAINAVMPGFGPGFVAIAILFFAFTTLVGYTYILQTNVAYISGSTKGPLMWAATGAMLVSIYYGAVNEAELIWSIGDFAYAITTWLNLAVNLLLIRVVLKTVRDYDKQKNMGLDPHFDPACLGISGATYWEDLTRDTKLAEKAGQETIDENQPTGGQAGEAQGTEPPAAHAGKNGI